jgi:hypothetical protein
MCWPGASAPASLGFAAAGSDEQPREKGQQLHPFKAPIDAFSPEGERGEESLDSRWVHDPEHGWIYGGHPDATPEQMEQLKCMLADEKAAFAYSLQDLPGYCGDLAPAELKMKHDQPVWSPPRRYSPLELSIGDEKVGEMLAAGIISEIHTDCKYASATTMPAKKDADGNYTDRRFCIDLRKINDNSVVDRFRTPLPEELFQRMQGSTWLTKLDCRSGFFNVPLSDESKQYTAFWWRGKLFAFNRLPFGHVNSTAIFQRIMETELQRAGLSHCAVVFVDDVCVHSRTFEEHLIHVRALLRLFIKVGLRAHPGKTIVATDALPYLGHVVSATGLRPEQAKVAAMQQLPEPKTAEQVRSCLGVLGFYRCYVPAYSRIAQPLNALLRSNTKFEWGPEQREAYAQLKAALTVPGLALRHPDPDLPFHLYVDWSTKGIAAVLNQRDRDGHEYMVACLSRSLNEHEQRYEAWKGEMLASVWAIKSLRPYLHGRHFHLHTDHRPLLWLLTAKEPTGQQARWVLSLQEYTFSIVHKEGKSNIADLPSRFPLPTTADGTGARLDATGEPWQHPLPAVLHADGTPDRTDYSHELLTAQRQAEAPPAAPSNPLTAALLAHVTAPASDAQLQHQLLQFVQQQHDDGIDAYAPMPAALLAGNTGAFTDTWDAVPDHNQPWAVWRQQQLEQAARGWVQQAQPHHDPPALPGRCIGEPGQHGVQLTTQLCTAPVGGTYFPAASKGVVLLEVFGGVCAGLEMCLRNGTPVKQYLYLDCDPISQRIAAHRIAQLMALYPLLLPPSAVAGAFALPQDVRALTTDHLLAVGASEQEHPWLIVGGWPCQDLSPAGKGLGLRGERSSLLHELVRVIGALQQLQPRMPPAYVIENVPFQFNSSEQLREDFTLACNIIGEPTVLDAAQFGSLAHRVRNFWSNLCSPQQLAAAAARVQRPAGRTVQLALGPGRHPQAVKHPDMPPRYPCNEPGQPMQAWPTLMAHPYSYAFRAGQPGSVTTPGGGYDQPTAVEREFALGYPRDSTAAPGVTEQQRRRALGECMDSHCMQCVYAIAHAWWQTKLPAPAPLPQNEATFSAAALLANEPANPHSVDCMLCIAAAAQERLQAPAASSDIWCDAPALHRLQAGTFPADLTAAERGRITKRLAYYKWQDGKLLRTLPDGMTRLVPKPSDRLALVKDFHERCGHFGVRRTAALVLLAHWWHGLQADVTRVVSGCKECSRVRAAFGSAQPAELHSLPIMGMFYRWGVDLCGPFPRTARGNQYIMVAVEHYSKHIEAVPIPDKRASTTAYAFAHHVLGRYGACAEVVHDNGGEWGGEFEQLLRDALIDSRATSANHPAANGAAEKSVHIVKAALKKMCLAKANTREWDAEVPWLLLGYRCSPQQSTGIAPYALLFAHSPVVPPAVVERLAAPLNYDDPARAAADLQRRKDLVKRLMPEAMANLQIAQHRDQLRYTHTHALASSAPRGSSSLRATLCTPTR